MYLIAVAYAELNKAEPDCGTTFTWAARAFGPITGWMGGWGIVIADIIVMSNLAQIAGSYSFTFIGGFGLPGVAALANNAVAVTIAGLIWIAVMTWICYRGIEVSARVQYVLLGFEIVILIFFAAFALAKVYTGNAEPYSLIPQWSWFNPFTLDFGKTIAPALLTAIFIYWGWDTAVSINEETKNPEKTPGRAAVISTLLLLATYAIVTVATVAFAGVGDKGIGLANPANSADVFSAIGPTLFGSGPLGSILLTLLGFSILTSASASTQTTILPTARTTLSMAVYKALPRVFAKVHPRYLTPSVSTLTFGGVSIVLYVILNNVANPTGVIADAVTALGMMIAFYYGLTGFACTWYYRHTLRSGRRNLWMRGILPSLGGIILYFALAWSLHDDWLDPDATGAASYTVWQLPFAPHWRVGGAFLLGVGTLVVGVVLMIIWRFVAPPFFRGETLDRDTPTLVPDDGGLSPSPGST
jgi:amino acid transporter